MPVKRLRTTRARVRLTDWQAKYLVFDGQNDPKPDDFAHWVPDWPACLRLCDGERPVFFSPALSRHPRELWRDYGEDFLPAFIQEHPGQRPLPWWQFDAPGCADPKDPDNYYRKIQTARRRSAWKLEKQTEFLKKHNLLTDSEKKILTG
jgi:hypothetical protein